MLKGVASCISPDLLKVLAEMGHGDELVLADAHFPGHSVGERTLRADGVPIAMLLDGILRLIDLDTYAAPLAMMAPVEGDELDPSVASGFMAVVRVHQSHADDPVRLERHTFYERSRRAYAVVMTGETRKYGNLILKKGVTRS